jgi:biopolymer transport protein ExbD
MKTFEAAVRGIEATQASQVEPWSQIMRTDYSSARQRQSTEIMMTPMIDVVFLLLVFFLATSSFDKPEQLLPGGVSQAAKPIIGTGNENILPPEIVRELDDCIVRIISRGPSDEAATSDYEFSLNGAPVANFESLNERMKSILSIRQDVPVIVDPDPSVAMEIAIRVYDAARRLGGQQVFFAVK